jgi:hypothetical protein
MPLAALTALALSAAADTLHVPDQYATIQAALDAAQAGDTVLVANGTWTGDGNRNLDFAGKAITLRSAGGADQCTLDAQGTPAQPQRVLVFDNGETRGTRVEGFTITGGDTLPGAIADQFNGGGVQILASAPTISNCIFRDNRCGCWGAAVYAGHGGKPLIENSMFIGNFADDDGGAFFAWNGSSVDVRNSVFIDNGAGTGGGGAIVVLRSGAGQEPSTIFGSTFVGNHANYGSALIAYDTRVQNSIIWGDDTRVSLVSNWTSNLRIDYSDVQGGFDGIGNLNLDPQLINAYLLSSTSPVIDMGDPGAIVKPGELDIENQPRVVNGRIDMGAVERQPNSFKSLK